MPLKPTNLYPMDLQRAMYRISSASSYTSDSSECSDSIGRSDNSKYK